jgi:hypothetical protein
LNSVIFFGKKLKISEIINEEILIIEFLDGFFVNETTGKKLGLNKQIINQDRIVSTVNDNSINLKDLNKTII